MRFTKQFMRDLKRSYVARVNELTAMSDEQLDCELKRCFPSVIEASQSEAMRTLLLDWMDRAIGNLSLQS